MLLFFIGFLALISNSSYGNISCHLIYKNYKVPSLTSLNRQVEQKNKKIPMPKLTDPQEEQKFLSLWNQNNQNIPRILKNALPQGITLIDYSLLNANEAGVVKTNSGYMVHGRLHHGLESTNVGFNMMALYDNLERTSKTLVRKEAKAVIIFFHGGGTITTGHHVAVNMLNHFHSIDVDVISLDLPWHALGSRKTYKNLTEYLEHLRYIIKTFVTPSGVPVFLAGHSLGGVISDLYLKHYPNDDLVRGIISLSTVADPLPGAPLEIKNKINREINERNLTNPLIPESERNLTEQLIIDNKISPICGLTCSWLTSKIDWLVDPSLNYLPSLFIIGRGDSLYQGYEKSFSTYIKSLPNSELYLITPRRTFRDLDGNQPLSEIGHLIFDHKPLIEFAPEVPLETRKKILKGALEESEFNELKSQGLITVDPRFQYEELHQPETFVLMQHFIEKITQQKFTRQKKPIPLLPIVLATYANNLIFREFADQFLLLHQKATPKTVQIGEKLQNIMQQINELDLYTKKKRNKLSESEEALLTQLEQQFKQTKAYLTGEAAIFPHFQQEYQKVQNSIEQITQQLKKIIKQKTNIRLDIEQSKEKLTQIEKIMDQLKPFLHSPVLTSALKAQERVLNELLKQYSKIMQIEELPLNQHGSLLENLTSQEIQEFYRYSKISKAYQRISTKNRALFLEQAALGNLTINRQGIQFLESRKDSFNIDPTQSFEQWIQQQGSLAMQLKQKIQELTKAFESQDLQYSDLATQLFHLENQKAQMIDPTYFTYSYVSFKDILDREDAQEILKSSEMQGILQKLWESWKKIWSERTQETTIELY